MYSRRFLLTRGVASIVILGAGYATWRGLHSDIGPAQSPWRMAGDGFDDVRLHALSYAILAPSPHNRQPWLIALEGDDAITLYCDLDRLLPETDPTNRQITIGLGAFVEVLRQAANEAGYSLKATPFPEGVPEAALDERPIVHVRFERNAEETSDPLFDSVVERRTVRAPFDQSKAVSNTTLAAIGGVLASAENEFQWTNDPARVAALKDICRDGWRVESATPRTHHESTKLTRIGDDEINANPDGISLSGPFLEAMAIVGVLTREKLDDPTSKAFKGGSDFYETAIDSAMAFGWLVTKANSRIDQLNAGADWVRLHLAATRAGLAMHPLSQVLQEFPEMAALYSKVHDVVGVDAPRRIQGLFRFGYADFPAPAPRWPMTSRLIEL